MCMSPSLVGGFGGGKLIESKKVQGLVKKNFENTIGGAVMKNNINKSSSSRPVKSTAPSLSSTKGRTGLNINNYVPIRKY